MKKIRKHEKCEDSQCEVCKIHIPFEIPNEIIAAIKNKDLVIFAGSGISSENKQVFPYSLYEDISGELKINNKKKKLSFSKLMSKYCKQNNGRRKLLNKIKERLDYIQSFPELYWNASQFHRELSTIYNIKEIITTNWDDLFERECGANPIVIPEDFVFWKNPNRKVLKIHGSINNYGSIIATEEDYKKCYKRLRDSILGSYLKNLLATKTVLFVGYSFGDEDFNKIYKFLKSEMKGLSPHSYLITLDEEAKKKFNPSEITIIQTDAVFFIQEIKKRLANIGEIIPGTNFKNVEKALFFLKSKHNELVRLFNPSKFPTVIYTASYQDGLIHSFERFFSQFKTGQYSTIKGMEEMICHYTHYIANKEKEKKFWDVAYFLGYRNGLLFMLNGNEVKDLPIYYILESDKVCFSLKEYTKLIKSKKRSNKYTTYAKKLVKTKGLGKGLIFHHTPFG